LPYLDAARLAKRINRRFKRINACAERVASRANPGDVNVDHYRLSPEATAGIIGAARGKRFRATVERLISEALGESCRRVCFRALVRHAIAVGEMKQRRDELEAVIADPDVMADPAFRQRWAAARADQEHVLTVLESGDPLTCELSEAINRAAGMPCTTGWLTYAVLYVLAVRPALWDEIVSLSMQSD
jgi:hypothetical protein